jgi:hypothetical protein
MPDEEISPPVGRRRFTEKAAVLRIALAGLIGLLLASPHAIAQDWALKMFNTTTHDFGTVARGSKTQFRFQLKNIYEEDAHILGVKSSCGCTTPHVTRSDLKTYETSEIVADFNTRDYQGRRTATLTVMLDCVSHATVQLRVNGVIRTDVVMQPGSVDFGSVDLGTPAEKKIQVSYAGREDWKIFDAKTAENYFEVELTELERAAGKVSYELLVRLTKDAPVGYIKDQLILVTNDERSHELPVDLQGRVVPDITISPKELFIGVVQPGRQVTKNVVIQGKKPFRILDIKCPDKSFTIRTSKEAKSLHLIPVVFTAGDDPGRISQKITIRTDQGKNVVQAFTAFAEIVKSDAATSPEVEADPDAAPSRTDVAPSKSDGVRSKRDAVRLKTSGDPIKSDDTTSKSDTAPSEPDAAPSKADDADETEKQ